MIRININNINYCFNIKKIQLKNIHIQFINSSFVYILLYFLFKFFSDNITKYILLFINLNILFYNKRTNQNKNR